MHVPVVKAVSEAEKSDSTTEVLSSIPSKASPGGTLSSLDSYLGQTASKSYVKDATPLKRQRKVKSVKQPEGRAGRKDDAGKPRMDLLPWKALLGVARILGFGAKKYTANGWRTVPQAKERYTAALLRHLAKLELGEVYDEESGLRHIDHIACNALFLAELLPEGGE